MASCVLTHSPPPPMTAKSPPIPAPSPEQIGLRIRALRKRQKRTLAWLSAQCGLDKGFLSRLERGEKSASVGTLHTVAGALGSSLSALLGEADPQTEIQIVRAADRHRMTTAPGPGEHIYEAITLGSSHSGLSVMVVEVGTHGAHTEAHHGGDELIFVLDGCIRVHFGGHTVLLERDDSVRFPGYLPHSLSAEGRKLARALVVIASG
ncbi:helix-turn-helix domain-containing protein [Bordetella parapertussis]|uniref:Transcriptional regulatory protein n=1 Tax=Bordetella parapertussis (strain Bpp5) TaxID=1208660 RepID=K0MJZ9_BORPB|nr:cupin domain-containing protein [Bordetella parapertussis]CCJ50147.1 putative transcriptional regulatory protein [Bordetella parapertussis Bpp5]